MKKLLFTILLSVGMLSSCTGLNGLDSTHLLSAGQKAMQAATISDDQIQEYVHQYIVHQDQESNVAPANNKYAQRLAKLTNGLTDVDGLPLNFKVYITSDVNAFACADGSVRVYSGLMDLMDDDEVLGVIGHEVGHVAHKDTKNAFKNALLTSALFDGLGSTSSSVATLTDSQLGAIAQSVMSAKYSQKQESNADEYGYDFLKRSGKNPLAMAQAFRKLESLEGQSASQTNGLYNLFSSHPTTAKRIKAIEDHAKRDNIKAPAGYVWQN